MKKLNLPLVTLLFTTLFFNTNLHAKDDYKLSVGGGVMFKKNNRVGNTYEDMDKKYVVKPIPFLTGQYKRLSLSPLGVSYEWLRHGPLSSSLFVTRTGDRYHGQGMNPRKDSGFAGLSTKFGKFTLIYAHDIHGRSKSNFAKLAYSQHFFFSKSFFLISSLHLDWYDDLYANYYYGVREHEVTPERKQYTAKNYIHPALALMPMFKITPRLNLSTMVNFSYVPDQVRNSPTTTNDRFAVMGMVGLSYDLF